MKEHGGRIHGRLLIDERQPFGDVDNDICMPAGLNGVPMMDKHPGPDKHVGNNGMDKVLPMNMNPFPGAEDYASAHYNNPYFWTGHPEKR